MSSYVTPGKRKRVYERDNYTCRYCGKNNMEKGDISIDHVIPKSKGGDNSMENLVTACYECNNLKKGTKTLDESGMKLIEVR